MTTSEPLEHASEAPVPATIATPSPLVPRPATPIVIEGAFGDPGERLDDPAPASPAQDVHDLLLREQGRAVLLAQNVQTESVEYQLGQLKASWLAELKSAASRPVYARDFDQFLDYCVEYDLNPLTLDKPQFALFVTWLRTQTTRDGTPYKPNTLARKVSEIASFYAYLLDVEAIERSPVSKRARPDRDDSKTDKTLKPEEVEILITDAATGHTTLGALCAELIVEVLAATGIRVSELCNSNLDQLRFVEEDGVRNRSITFRGKGGKVHVRAIPAEVDARLLTPYLAQRPKPASLDDAPALFLTLEGKRVDRWQVYRLLGRSAQRGKTERKATPHWLRHTWNDQARRAGIPLEDRQEALGHSSAATTQRYGAARQSVVNDPAHVVAQRLYAARHTEHPAADSENNTDTPITGA